jgi:hypothetical protein
MHDVLSCADSFETLTNELKRCSHDLVRCLEQPRMAQELRRQRTHRAQQGQLVQQHGVSSGCAQINELKSILCDLKVC